MGYDWRRSGPVRTSSNPASPTHRRTEHRPRSRPIEVGAPGRIGWTRSGALDVVNGDRRRVVGSGHGPYLPPWADGDPASLGSALDTGMAPVDDQWLAGPTPGIRLQGRRRTDSVPSVPILFPPPTARTRQVDTTTLGDRKQRRNRMSANHGRNSAGRSTMFDVGSTTSSGRFVTPPATKYCDCGREPCP